MATLDKTERIISPGYRRAQLTLVGTSPLLMNSVERRANLFDPETRAFKVLSKKARKTIDDEMNLQRMEWELGMYWSEELGPFIPGGNVLRLLSEAATRWSMGAEVNRSVEVVDFEIPLAYDGPRDIEGLWDQGYRFTTMTRNAGRAAGRVPRCRACFEEWTVSTVLAHDPEDVEFDLLVRAAQRARKYGLGDGRTIGFGRFNVEVEAL